ncbi:MAG: nucleoside triphosphate pyrophosphohydrolase [Bacteroidales bacterium]|nr:nucleoside triphosphate pyrophosphohydrolase [Bacteroidales bacterium]MDY0216323.1 nucleoside triphosphate pyrophosphohydrolase [Bacteroidales bacterium]
MNDPKLIAFKRLLDIMNDLRAACPWDREQTFESLRILTIEEVYELSDEILDKNPEGIKKELGDLMLHLVFYSKIAEEKDYFDVADVLHSICEKLIRRHPHIYGDALAESPEDVKNHWEKIKMREGHRSVLSGVPRHVPSLVKAFRIQEKASGIGFDWDNRNQVWEKVQEELQEFHVEAEAQNGEKMEEEFGDLLFALVNYARFLNINPDDALEKTNLKFIKRFTYLEEQTKEANQKLSEMTLDEMNVIWEESKKI